MYCRTIRLNAQAVRQSSKLVIRKSTTGGSINNEEKSSQPAQQTTTFSDGPSLSDFIGGVVPRGSTWKEYQGKLKREKGENER